VKMRALAGPHPGGADRGGSAHTQCLAPHLHPTSTGNSLTHVVSQKLIGRKLYRTQSFIIL
jgi:hypothetical protein